MTDNSYEFPLDVAPLGGNPPLDPAAEKRFRAINGRRKDWLDADGRVVPKTYR